MHYLVQFNVKQFALFCTALYIYIYIYKESDIVKKMKGTFDNYFLGCTFVFAIAAVFDPRTNLEFVRYSFRYLYGDSPEKHMVIENALGDIF